MRPPRLSISLVMALVAIAALNLGAVRALTDDPHLRLIGEILLMGALPMANILAVSTLIRHQRHGSHPFLVGFEVFGTMALVFFVYVASVGSHLNPVIWPYIELWSMPIHRYLWHRPKVLNLTLITVSVVMLGLPQVVFALIGGLVFRRFKRQSANFSG